MLHQPELRLPEQLRRPRRRPGAARQARLSCGNGCGAPGASPLRRYPPPGPPPELPPDSPASTASTLGAALRLVRVAFFGASGATASSLAAVSSLTARTWSLSICGDTPAPDVPPHPAPIGAHICQNPQALTEVNWIPSGSHRQWGAAALEGRRRRSETRCSSSHNQVPSNGIAGKPGSIVDPDRALLIIGGLTNEPPDRNPNVDRIPASFILSYAQSIAADAVPGNLQSGRGPAAVCASLPASGVTIRARSPREKGRNIPCPASPIPRRTTGWTVASASVQRPRKACLP